MYTLVVDNNCNCFKCSTLSSYQWKKKKKKTITRVNN